MTVAVTSPITGSAQTGFTAPTYTHVADVAPDVNGKQVAVTALGGTQTGASAHSVSSPFTCTFKRPKALKVLGPVNSSTGQLQGTVQRNSYELLTRKGAIPLASNPAVVSFIRTQFDIPVGTDTASPAEIRAALSCHIGYLTQVSAGLGDTLVSGVM
jgi:hypothetical protein